MSSHNVFVGESGRAIECEEGGRSRLELRRRTGAGYAIVCDFDWYGTSSRTAGGDDVDLYRTTKYT
jgi:hypothetical protein